MIREVTVTNLARLPQGPQPDYFSLPMVFFPQSSWIVEITCDGEVLSEYALKVNGFKAEVYIPSVAGKVRLR